jgi:GAF domain-containing protein
MNNPGRNNNQQIIEAAHEIIANPAAGRDEKMQNICKLLAENVDVFDWVGFYLPDPEADRELILGPFIGADTEHTRIPFGQGICGQAAATNDTFVVQDIGEADNYLSCSADVRAEIVAPVMKEGSFVAELDIDSHKGDSISNELKKLVEDICKITVEIF